MLNPESVKALLDSSWWNTPQLALGVTAVVLSAVYAPRSCEQGCSSCPWARDTEQRRRFWFWRATAARLWILWDTLVFVTCAGRVTVDLLLDEATWTLPLLAAFGAWVAREWFRDGLDLERVQAKRRELGLR